MKKILILLLTLISLTSLAQSQFSGIVLYVTDSATYRASTTITNAHSSGKADIYWNAQATSPHFDYWNGASYTHGFGSAGGGGGTNTSSALTDASTVTITGVKHTLTSDEATITWTLSQTPDFQTTDIILNATTTDWTFPANTLVVSEGVATGSNTVTLAGSSGDHYIMSIWKDGSNYRVVIKNFGQ